MHFAALTSTSSSGWQSRWSGSPSSSWWPSRPSVSPSPTPILSYLIFNYLIWSYLNLSYLILSGDHRPLLHHVHPRPDHHPHHHLLPRPRLPSLPHERNPPTHHLHIGLLKTEDRFPSAILFGSESDLGYCGNGCSAKTDNGHDGDEVQLDKNDWKNAWEPPISHHCVTTGALQVLHNIMLSDRMNQWPLYFPKYCVECMTPSQYKKNLLG